MSQENVELVLSFIDAANARDREQLARLSAPGFTRTSARERDGLPVPTSVDRHFDDLEEVWGTLRVEVEQVVDLGAGIYSLRGGHVARIDGFHRWDDSLEAAGLSD